MVKRVVPRLIAAVGLIVASSVFAVSPASALSTPAISSVASPATTVGLQVFDVVDLTGGIDPTGFITYDLYGPGATTCSSPIFNTTTTVNGDGAYDSMHFTTTEAGTYQWEASYSGEIGRASCRERV